MRDLMILSTTIPRHLKINMRKSLTGIKTDKIRVKTALNSFFSYFLFPLCQFLTQIVDFRRNNKFFETFEEVLNHSGKKINQYGENFIENLKKNCVRKGKIPTLYLSEMD